MSPTLDRPAGPTAARAPLRVAHEVARAMLGSVEEGLVLADARGRIRMANGPAARMLGAGGELRRRPLSRVLEEIGAFVLAMVVHGGEAAELELRREEAQGGQVLRARWQPLASGGGLLVLRDRQVEEARDRLQADFHSMIAHDLRSPVAVVHGYLDLLRKGLGGDLTPLQDEFAGRIGDKLEEVSRLLDDFLDLSRFAAGKVPVKMAAVDLHELLHVSAADMSLLASEQGQGLQLELPEELEGVSLCGDAQRLTQLLQNLLGNAIKYNRARGEITLRARREAGRLRLEVGDQGPGMDARERRMVFEPYVRLPGSEERAKGAGLGLLIVRKIAEAHGGRVGVDSEPGAGSTFWVELPLQPLPTPPAAGGAPGD